MSKEPAIEAPHPRETTALFGHHDAEAALLAAFRNGRIPHAWLIGGPRGIGKATLADRMARFVLAYGDPQSQPVQQAQTLAVPEVHPVARHIVAQSHAGLLALERISGDTGALRTVITVDQVRATVPFFGATATSWRVCIVDTVDELKWPEAPNALLKILEEPPPRTLFFLISHAPARVLATIQSRCRKLALRPLAAKDVASATATTANLDPAAVDVQAAARAAEGSVARALMLLENDALSLHEKLATMLQRLPQVDLLSVHALGDQLAGNDRSAFTVFVDATDRWLAQRLRAEGLSLPRLAKVSEVWEKISRAARETEAFNLDRKPFVFSVFGLLAEVA